MKVAGPSWFAFSGARGGAFELGDDGDPLLIAAAFVATTSALESTSLVHPKIAAHDNVSASAHHWRPRSIGNVTLFLPAGTLRRTQDRDRRMDVDSAPDARSLIHA